MFHSSPQRLTVGAEISPELIASACSLSTDDIETKNHKPCIASCGAPFIIAELKGREKLAAASPFRDRDREERLLLRLREHAIAAGLDPHQVERLYRVVMDMSVARVRQETSLDLGPRYIGC